MPKLYSLYCALLVITLAVANHKGYVYSDLFSFKDQAATTASLYHK